jgi:hypothetical protein
MQPPIPVVHQVQVRVCNGMSHMTLLSALQHCLPAPLECRGICAYLPPGPELLWDDQAESAAAASAPNGAGNELALPPGALGPASESSEVLQQECGRPEEGPLRLDAHTIYETALQCAFAAENCSSTKLETSGPWTWLLYTFAEQYGVRPFFCVLCHLR